jgi:sulfite exporter TauE/SafE/peroxiredoxin
MIPELLLIFTASLMGSIHCAGMCGGFTLSLVKDRSDSTWARVSVYHAGKIFTYIFIGGVAGFVGAALLANPAIRAAQFIFSSLAGVMIVTVGLQTLGLLPGQNLVNRIASRLWLGPFLGPFFKTFRERDSLDGAFFLGLFNGFLPCGLVYTFALTAAAAASLFPSLLIMLAFGLGTVPMLLMVAWGGGMIATQQTLRPFLSRLAGVIVIVLGIITVWRGLPLLPAFASQNDHHVGHTLSTVPKISSIDLEPSPAPNFTLIDQDGNKTSLHDFHGKVVVMDFIHTTCTSTCPVLTATFREVQNGLGADFGKNVILLSITIDPAADTPPVLKSFGEKWSANFSGWKFLTGSEEQVRSVTNDYAVYVDKNTNGLQHTETIIVIDRHMRLRSVFALQTDPQTVIKRAAQLGRE